MVRGNWIESDGVKRRAGKPKNFYPKGEGRIYLAGELETGGFYCVAECDGPVEEYLSDLIRQAKVEIFPVKLCPKNCDYCPPFVIPPLRSDK